MRVVAPSCLFIGSISYKKQQRNLDFFAAFPLPNRLTTNLYEIIFRGFRRKQLISYGHGHGGKPTHADRSSLPFSRGSRACSLFFCCEAEMFFSLFSIFFIVIIRTLGLQKYL